MGKRAFFLFIAALFMTVTSNVVWAAQMELSQEDKLVITDSIVKLHLMGVTGIGPSSDYVPIADGGNDYIYITSNGEPNQKEFTRLALLMALIAGEDTISNPFGYDSENNPNRVRDEKIFSGKYRDSNIFRMYLPREGLVKAGKRLLGYTLSEFPDIGETVATDEGYYVKLDYFGDGVYGNVIGTRTLVEQGASYFANGFHVVNGLIYNFASDAAEYDIPMFSGIWNFEAAVKIVDGHWRIVKLSFEATGKG